MQTRPLIIILLLAACSPKPSTADSDGDSSSSDSDGGSVTSATDTNAATTGTASTATSGPVTSPTTDTAPTTDPAPMTTGETTSATSMGPGTSGVTNPSTDTGEPAGGLPGACGTVCAHWDMCSPGSVGSLSDCKAACIDGFEDPPECAAAMAAQWECVADLSCEEALKFLDGEPTSCLAEIGATDRACSDEECGGEIGGDMQTCMLEQQCGDGKQQYDCGVDVCTCIQDDVPGKECPSNDFCASSHEEQIAALTACCGWDWQF